MWKFELNYPLKELNPVIIMEVDQYVQQSREQGSGSTATVQNVKLCAYPLNPPYPYSAKRMERDIGGSALKR